MPEKKERFDPTKHYRNLKGQLYLEVKYRIVWFREEHPDGYIRTELIEHDAAGGMAVFKAAVGYWTPEGREVYANGHGSETRKDFGDYAEKAETKAVGRALAMLGYGTAQAIELDEGERSVVDSPVERRGTAEASPSAPPRGNLALVREGSPAPPDEPPPPPAEEGATRAAREAALRRLLSEFKDAAAALQGRDVSQLSDANLDEAAARLQARKRLAETTKGLDGEALAAKLFTLARGTVVVLRKRKTVDGDDCAKIRALLQALKDAAPLPDDADVDVARLPFDALLPQLELRLQIEDATNPPREAVASGKGAD